LLVSGRRFLIVNADDFGMSRAINGGILEAHARGVVTSASLLVRWPAAVAAAAAAQSAPHLGLGLHVDLGEWAFQDGEWKSKYEVVPLADRAAIEDEVQRQLNRFHELTHRHPTHLDSHQHIHCHEPARSVLMDVARKLGAPLRHFTPLIHYCGSFYGQTGQGEALPGTISRQALERILRELPPGVTELCCHPGWPDELDTMYCTERAKELETLCETDVRRCLDDERIELTTFADCWAAWAANACRASTAGQTWGVPA
jgi:chitin disaccharide deacetylase